MDSKSDELAACPFCGGDEAEIRENGRVWTGMKYGEPASVSVRHWCPADPGQPSRLLERVGRDHASAIAAWNRRAASSARSEEMAALRAIVCKLVKARNRAPDVVAFSDMVDEFIEDAAALTPTEKPE